MSRPHFPLPTIAVFSAVAILAIALSAMTYRNLHWERQQMQTALLREGLTLIHTFEAGARTGMMGMMWSAGDVQTLIEEAASQPEVAFIALVNARNIIIAHSDSTRIGQSFHQKLPPSQDGTRAGLVEFTEAQRLFAIAHPFQPMAMPGQGMEMRSTNAVPRASHDQMIIVGLRTDTYDKARAQDIRHAMLMGGILLLVGSAGFYLVLALQKNTVMQRTLNELSDYTHGLIQHMSNGLISLDRAGRIVTLNPAAERILQQDMAEMRGMPYQQVWDCTLLESLLNGECTSFDQEVECLLPSGKTVPLGLSATVLRDENRELNGVVCLFRDLTELRQLQEHVRRTDRLAAVGEFAAGIAHEIRNPLNTLKGFAQYLHSKLPQEDDKRRYTQLMVKESERLNRIISELLDFTRPVEPQFADISANRVLDETLMLMEADARAQGIELVRVYGDALPLISADAEKLKQVFLNLFLNAFQVMPKGGTLKIGTRRASDNVEVQIADSGSGISAEDLPHIFEPFFSRKKGGTGLGLAIVHRIVEAHGGTLRVESDEGVGTTFSLRFPLADERTGSQHESIGHRKDGFGGESV